MSLPRIALFTAVALPLWVNAEVQVVDSSATMGGNYNNAYDNSGAYAGGSVAAPSAQGGLFLQLQQMEQELTRLRGMVEEQQYKIQQLERDSQERYDDLNSRLGQGGAAAAATAGQAASQTPAPVNAAQTPTAPVQPAAEADPEKEKLYYEAAFDLIKNKDFDNAIKAFSAFLRKYPQSQYAGNAQYWLGEVHLAQGGLQEAGKAFALVNQNYASHPKVSDALYKLGVVEQRLGNADKAKAIFQQVAGQYPNSSAAGLARRELGQ
ncbi:tol-pal system protein YbgF [Atopomonas sediminilitoris]|uniref:tol-pal system protein YbgF n=1 Tax=Atopomonas sediminilitoris TaxID=2919919 RepID=UPI001F4E1D3E|nr:tol-pal system protein YbgF [Atopomonas sediminilitoris]MCJ8167995.1 tol-pal system protein YbgF [Atopomonas sediminilitoris]